jgi:NAD+ synthase (glutamine-hydrolysing)
MGAVVIANPSASPEEVGKADYRRTIVRAASGKHVLAYVYSGSDMSESTGEVVMSGHRIHAVNGQVVDEVQPFGNDYKLLISDIDIGQLRSERRKRKFPNSFGADVVKVDARNGNDMAYYHVDANPFLPDEDSARRAQRLDTAINIMRWGLIGRLNSVGGKVVIGLSGGLDSALALLVACEAFDQLGLSRTDIHAVVLPGAASSSQTQSNAVKLAQALGVTCRKIPIAQTAGDKLARHGHDGVTQDIAYENAQAFQRTDELYTHAAVVGGFLLCTGDLSEMALGWSTYGADQNNGGYNTNCGIPKTMAQALVRHLASQAKYAAASGVLLAVLDTPISPELTKQTSDEISQSTEDIIGPYKLNDFFLYWWFKGQTPETICKKAVLAFGADYDAETIATWLQKFIRRFISAQYKRENVPDGPIVGTVSLSPRGRWRAPADVRFRPPSDEEAQKFVERAVNWANHHN